MYFDEVDLGFKLRALGFRIIGSASTKYYYLIGGTVSKLHEFKPVKSYYQTRNKLLMIVKYFHGKYLLKALVLNLIILLAHFVKGPNLRRRIIVKAVLSCLKKLRSVLRDRETYLDGLKKNVVLDKFVAPWRSW